MKLDKASFVFLLLYSIATIIFWGMTLQKQNNQITKFELELNDWQNKAFGSVIDNQDKVKQILENKKNRTLQYIGEGAAFVIITLIAAYAVYVNLKRNKKLSELQNNFMLSITHELKSPISGVKLNLQTLKRANLPEATKTTLIERSIFEADRLNDLCNNLILASQMERNKVDFNFEPIDFSTLCSTSVKDLVARSHHELVSEVEAEITVEGDPLMWKIAIHNLIENAIKYSPRDSTIKIKLSKEDEQIILAVADQGAGIPNDEKEKIFKKFYRIGNENSRTSKGTGLGLYLIAEIVKYHHASITVKDNEPNGTIFEINIPT